MEFMGNFEKSVDKTDKIIYTDIDRMRGAFGMRLDRNSPKETKRHLPERAFRGDFIAGSKIREVKSAVRGGKSGQSGSA